MKKQIKNKMGKDLKNYKLYSKYMSLAINHFDKIKAVDEENKSDFFEYLMDSEFTIDIKKYWKEYDKYEDEEEWSNESND